MRPIPRLARRLLRIDSGAGLLAGAAVLALSGWLAPLYDLPRALLLGMGVANLAYGTFSGSLAVRRRRPRGLIVALAAANATWALLCLAGALRFRDSASPFGLAHLIGEGALVGTLAALEWRWREHLTVR